jgi:nucleolar protein 58
LDGSLGLEYRAKVEARLMQLEGRAGVVVNAAAVSVKPVMKKVEILPAKSFNAGSDLVLDAGVKRKADDIEETEEEAAAAKKAKKAAKKLAKEGGAEVIVEEVEVKEKKAKKQKKEKKAKADE